MLLANRSPLELKKPRLDRNYVVYSERLLNDSNSKKDFSLRNKKHATHPMLWFV